MSPRILKYLVISLLMAAPPASSAQVNITEFRRAFKENIAELLAVYNFRGINFICNYRDDEAYEKVVFEFLEHWDSAARKPVFIFYSKTPDSLSTWLFADGQIYQHQQALTDSSLMRLETELRESLAVDNTRGSKRGKKKRGSNLVLKPAKKRKWETAVASLTDVLLPEILRPHLTGRGHLFILPELNIGQIPFWILKPFGNESYLVDSMSFSWVPHVCKFEEFSKANSSLGKVSSMHFKSPLIVGNPKYHAALQLSDLPGAEAEARAVAGILKSPAFTGTEASVAVVRNGMENADLIYLATHASCSMEDILNNSWIAFTPSGEYDKGLIKLYEVQRMMIDCRMAVLSACQTGYGKVLDGGFVGLGRAFFKAGVDFTVMSLWSVNDEATSYMMTRFMQNVLQPSAYQPAEPLRQAILSTKEKYPHPALWSPFVLFGFTY